MYVALDADANAVSPVLFAHFLFTVFGMLFLEWMRKMKPVVSQNKYPDTYTQRFGIIGAAVIYLVLSAIMLIAFYFVTLLTFTFNAFFLLSIALFVSLIIFDVFFVIYNSWTTYKWLMIVSLVTFGVFHLYLLL